MPAVPRHASGTIRHEPGRHLAAGVPRGFVDVLAKAPTLATALTLAVVALCIAILVMPIDEKVRATPRRAPWPVAVLAFAMAIFAITYICLERDED
jgi:hypothetical protein